MFFISRDPRKAYESIVFVFYDSPLVNALKLNRPAENRVAVQALIPLPVVDIRGGDP